MPSDPGSGSSDAAARRAGLVAAIAAVTIAGLGFTLLQPLLSVRLEERGVSGGLIGLMGATVAIGMLVGGVTMPAVLRHVALPVLLLGAALASAALLLLMVAFDGYAAWLLLRTGTSFAGTALFYGSELWIVATAPPERRGTWIGIYTFFLALGFFGGPTLLSLVGTAGALPFLVGAGVMLLAAVPVLLGRGAAPRDLGAERQSLGATLGFFRSDPTLMTGILLFSCFEFGMLGLLPVWGMRVGHAEATAILFVSAVALAGLVLNLPLGMLADRVNRRAVMVAAGAALAAAGLLLPIIAGSAGAVTATLAAAGGLAIALYVLPLAEFGARYRGPRLAQANGAAIFAYGLGALVSPLGLGALMEALPPHGLPWGIAAAALLFVLLALARARAARPGRP